MPFWRQGFLPVPLTRARFFTACVTAPFGGIGTHDGLPHEIELDWPRQQVVAHFQRSHPFILCIDDVDGHLRLRLRVPYFLPFGFSTCGVLTVFAVIAFRTMR